MLSITEVINRIVCNACLYFTLYLFLQSESLTSVVQARQLRESNNITTSVNGTIRGNTISLKESISTEQTIWDKATFGEKPANHFIDDNGYIMPISKWRMERLARIIRENMY
jgi:hypothetical protein